MLLQSPTDVALASEGRRRWLDSPRVLVSAGVLLLAIMAALFWLANRTSEIAPQLLTDVLLYALLAVDLVLLAALAFVLGRNLLKLWVEQRRAAPFARFRGKLPPRLVGLLKDLPVVAVARPVLEFAVEADGRPLRGLGGPQKL